MRKKRFPLIVIFVLVTLVVAVYFGYQYLKPVNHQAPVTTPISVGIIPSSWKTYTSKDYNLSFKYPDTFKVELSSDTVLSVCPIKSNESSNESCLAITPDFTYSAEDYILLSTKTHKDEILESSHTVTIGENTFTAFKLESWAGPNVYPKEYFIFVNSLDNKSVMFSYYASQQKEVFYQVLSTFKFTQ